jgi:hypothetical protein
MNKTFALPKFLFFDDLLRLPLKNQGWTIDQCERLFTAALKYYAQKRDGNERRLFIKTDSWHIFFYEQIRKVFPDVPFILLYRSPTEVLLSHTKQRGLQAVPGLIEPELFGFEPDNIANQSLDAYTAKVLERYLSRYIEITQKDKHVLLLNYNQGPMAMVQDIATFTSTPISDDIKLKMKERSGYHSKRPDQLFSGEATQHLPVFLKRADELYREVDAFRLAVV